MGLGKVHIGDVEIHIVLFGNARHNAVAGALPYGVVAAVALLGQLGILCHPYAVGAQPGGLPVVPQGIAVAVQHRRVAILRNIVHKGHGIVRDGGIAYAGQPVGAEGLKIVCYRPGDVVFLDHLQREGCFLQRLLAVFGGGEEIDPHRYAGIQCAADVFVKIGILIDHAADRRPVAAADHGKADAGLFDGRPVDLLCAAPHINAHQLAVGAVQMGQIRQRYPVRAHRLVVGVGAGHACFCAFGGGHLVLLHPDDRRLDRGDDLAGGAPGGRGCGGGCLRGRGGFGGGRGGGQQRCADRRGSRCGDKPPVLQ